MDEAAHPGKNRRFKATALAGIALCAALGAGNALGQEQAGGNPAITAVPGIDERVPTFAAPGAPTNRPLRIIVYGDMRFTAPSNTTDTWPRVRKWLAERVAEEKPDLLLLTGDMPFHGSDPEDWKVYDRETAGWQKEHLLIYPTLGNHEIVPNRHLGMEYYFQAYPQIAHRRWYSVQYGNVFVIELDTEIPFGTGSPQRQWLEGQLAHLPASADFVFFLFHVPLIADLQTAFMIGIPTPGGLNLRHYLEAQAAASHAKFAVFNGHIHNYERFEINGITHVISGGGGARPYPIFIHGDEELDHIHTYPNFNYVVITLQGKHADARMYRVVDPNAAAMSVKEMDSFTLDAK